MANIFQKIFYNPMECKVLDFIKEHKDSVEYFKGTKFDEFNVDVGVTHNVSIHANGMSLSACLTKYKSNFPFRDSDVSYTFQCDKPKVKTKCKNCKLNEPIGGFSGFASTVYSKMLDHYVRQHGCPCER